MAGPCAVESREQIMAAAQAVKKSRCAVFKGRSFQARTSPYSFQGLEEEGLKLLKEAKEATGLLIITEVTSERAIEIATVMLTCSRWEREMFRISSFCARLVAPRNLFC